nr:MAG TPA: hypothetical protein [Caudoviricetes sp.]
MHPLMLLLKFVDIPEVLMILRTCTPNTIQKSSILCRKRNHN